MRDRPFFEPWNEACAALSDEGVRRRDAGLESLRRVVRARGRRQRALRAAIPLVVAAIVVAALLPLAIQRGPRVASNATAGDTSVAAADYGAPTALKIEFVATDPGIAARIAMTPALVDRSITDWELQRALVEAGHDPGMVRVGGRVMLASDLGADKREPPGG